jgi:hypothetical protein
VSDRAASKFRATAGTFQGCGTTPQEALAELIRRLPDGADLPIVIWPHNRGDAFFSELQQARLQELKGRREALTPEEQAELEDLIAAAFDATVARTQSLPLVTR